MGTMHPSDKGYVTEAVVLAELVKLEVTVLVPHGNNHRYDLVIDRGKGFERVQCKTAHMDKGSVVFNAYSHSVGSKDGTRGYFGEADLFGVYCVELDETYLVPVEEQGPTKIYLRVDPYTNGRTYEGKQACDYRIDRINVFGSRPKNMLSVPPSTG